MRLNLVRRVVTSQSTIGTLDVNNERFCYTLERPSVQIPVGIYPIEMTNSLDLTCECGPNHSLSHLLPLLDNVPGRSAIRIHAGNWPRDSEGCILVGLQKGPDSIFQSRLALDPLVLKIQAALKANEAVTIAITKA